MLLSRLFLRRTKTRKTTVPADCMALELHGTELKLRGQDNVLIPVGAGTTPPETSGTPDTALKAYVKQTAVDGVLGDPNRPFSSIRLALDSYADSGPVIRHLVLIPAEWGEPFPYEANIDDAPFFVESCYKPQLSSYTVMVDIVASARITFDVGTVVPGENSLFYPNISSDRSVALTLSGVQNLACSMFVLNLHSLASFVWDETFSVENLMTVDITVRNSGQFNVYLVSATTNPSLEGCHVAFLNSGSNDSTFTIAGDLVTPGVLATNGTNLDIYGSMCNAVDSADNVSGSFGLTIGGSGYAQLNVAPTELSDLGGNYTHNFW